MTLGCTGILILKSEFPLKISIDLIQRRNEDTPSPLILLLRKGPTLEMKIIFNLILKVSQLSKDVRNQHFLFQFVIMGNAYYDRKVKS